MNQTEKVSKWVAPAASVLLAGITFFAIVQLNKQADEYRQTTTQLAQIEANAQHISASEWQVIAEGDASRHANAVSA